MTMINSQAWDQLQPLWVMGSGQTDEKQYIYNYGTKIMASYGNNGSSMNAYVKGVARGLFKIQFKLGYTWGYSTFFMAEQRQITMSGPSSGNYGNSGVNGLRFMNNNSNNVLYVDKNVNGTTSRILNTTGVNDTMISLWRDSSNVVKYKIGSSSTTTVGTFTDTFVFGCTLQSPSSVELIMAMNLAVAAS